MAVLAKTGDLQQEPSMMGTSADHSLRGEISPWKLRRDALRSLPAAARLIWNASPKLVSCALALRVVNAVVPCRDSLGGQIGH